MRRSWPLHAGVAAALGALQSLAFLHPAAWPLEMLVVAAVAAICARLTPGQAARFGLLFGTCWLASGVWWLFISLHRYGGLPAGLAVGAIALLSLFLALYLSLAMAVFAAARGAGALGSATLFAALWLLAELARGVIFTGFPWLASGYAHVDSPLAAVAPWVGVYGVGFLSAWLSAWVALSLSGARRWRWAPLAGCALVLLVLAWTGPAHFTQPGNTLSVSLLQSQVSQDEKFDPAQIPQALAWARDEMFEAPGALVVAPETVIPLLPADLDPEYWPPIARHFHSGEQAVILGIPLGDEDTGYTNSALGISQATRNDPQGYYRYDKHHLVPFGEFIPTGFKWFTRLMNIPLGDFNRGPVGPASFGFRGERIGVNICYEDLFGEELAARFGNAAASPTIFANISNIGWFGDSIAIEQHLQISRMRTLEFQIPMLRATNTGATAVIDDRGRVVASLGHDVRGVLNSTVQGRRGVTPYAWWAARFGLWPLGLAALGLVVLSASSRRRRPR